MRRLDDSPIDPEIAAELDAIDATLAGDPVDPKHAEIAELALLLVGERAAIDPEFAAAMDARVRQRFSGAGSRAGSAAREPGLLKRAWAWWPQMGALAAGVAAVALIVVVAGSGGVGGTSSSSETISAAASTTASAGTAASAAAAPASPQRQIANAGPSSHAPASAAASGAAAGKPTAPLSAQSLTSTSSASTTSQASSAPNAPAPANSNTVQPPSNGRKIIQSAQLALTTAPNHVDDVAQEVFNVAGRVNGIVRRSSVTATGGSDGYAIFQLSVPSSSLADTMASLSRLQYAHVASRTDNTQDVNDTYVSVQHQLADAQALRTALLKQLANAVTQQQIDSLNAQIHDAEASIASDEATLRGLNKQINYSQVSVTINAQYLPAVAHTGNSGFTLGKAAHDAGRVLTVGAGVALIVLAVLVPLGLLAALAWWIWSLIRRRRREHALDMA